MRTPRVVLKYDLPATERFKITMPRGAAVLNVQRQAGAYRVWVLADPEDLHVDRFFAFVPTGAVFDADQVTYLATCVFDGGNLIFHLFEVDRSVLVAEAGRSGGGDEKSGPEGGGENKEGDA